MKIIKDEKVKLDIVQEEEAKANKIAFMAAELISLMAFVAVVVFLEGTMRDWIILIASLTGIVMQVLEKKTSRFRKYSKYLYMTISFWCICIVIITNDGKYAAVTQVAFVFLAVAIAYCDAKLVLYHAVITIVSIIGGLIFFPEAMFKVDELSIWIFILAIFIIGAILAAIIAQRMKRLIEETRQMRIYEDELIYLEQLEKKDERYKEFVHNMNHYFVAIGELAREDCSERIVNLVQELNGKILQNEQMVYTNHRVLNAILSQKSSEAEEMQIKLIRNQSKLV
ncbi:MAG: hypothetical protein IJN92_00465 [Lachnospiraceae bacterium]|nr:hypothetical protein [Lachnospiraceae bacterium]